MAEGVGKVYLVGAGPGDPGLFTLKGKRCLEAADVVVHDYLANKELLAHARPEAERIFVGKKGGDRERSVPQDQITAVLIEQARSGKTVARLKGGDPFIFGRGGEEAEALRAAGIPFEVVPGVTSAVAAPAYAGIPLTHRDFTSSVAFVTGHEDPEKPRSDIAWDKLATGVGTLVFLMGVGNLPEIVAQLTGHGRRPETPVALIRWGTRADQQTVTGTLGDIVERVAAAGLQPPAVIVVGEVVALREKLRWFEAKPLFGRRIVVTRAREQASALAERVQAEGAEVLEFPAIEIVPPESWEPLDAALRRIGEYGWIIFTSANGVRFFWERLRAAGRDARSLTRARVAAIGPATAEALRGHGLEPDVVPPEFKAEGLLAALADEPMAGVQVLLPRAATARDVLPATLEQRGATVHVVPAYRTVRSSREVRLLRDLLGARRVDAVTFTSSSTVTNFCQALGEADVPALLEGVTIACIGPITAETAREHGLVPHLVCADYTIPALVSALATHFSLSSPHS
jgi:uroporphyrinogen III methyltransferase/synthase